MSLFYFLNIPPIATKAREERKLKKERDRAEKESESKNTNRISRFIIQKMCKISWESAHPIGISYASGFRYLPDGSVCWMLLGGVEAWEIPLRWAHS